MTRCPVCGRISSHCEACHRSHEQGWRSRYAREAQEWVVDRRELRILRQNLGFTQADVGRRLEVSDSSIGSWERGERTPTLDVQYTWRNWLRVWASA